MYGYIIFADIEKYSSLKDADLKVFHSKCVPAIFEKLKAYKDSAIFWNTWGDAVVAVYDKAELAIKMALDYRDAFREVDFESYNIKALKPRIAGNFGEFEVIFDPALGKENVHGTMINLAARIESITLPGEIFVTKEFKNMAVSSYDFQRNCRFDDMGDVTLPKKAGEIQLFRLCRETEPKIKPVGNVYYTPFSDRADVYDIYDKDKKKENTIDNEQLIKSEKFFYDKRQKLINSEEKSTANTTPKGYEEKIYKKNNIQKLAQNPFIVALLIFIVSFLINKLFELKFMELIFNTATYYINYTVYLINAHVVSVLTFNNMLLPLPLTPKVLDFLAPWKYTRGILVSSFSIGIICLQICKRSYRKKSLYFTIIIFSIFLFSYYLINNKLNSSVLSILIESLSCYIGFFLAIKILSR